MIALSTLLYDPNGAVVLRELPSSELDTIERRVNRVKTLDGGVAVNDRGHSAGDRDLVVRWRVRAESEYRAVQRLVKLYPRLTVSTREGVFVAIPQSVRVSNLEGELRLLVISQEA